MTNETTTTTKLSITESLERLYAQPMPPITEPCTDWCNTAPHTDPMRDCAGGVGFNHTARFIDDPSDVCVAIAETIASDGSWERTPPVFYASLDLGETGDPEVVAAFARAATQGAALFARLTNPVDPFANVSDDDLIEEVQLRMERARETASE